MKKKSTIIIVTSLLLIFSAFKIVDDIIKKLGMEEKTAQSFILKNLIGRIDPGPMEQNMIQTSFQLPYARLLPSIINGDKVGASKELCNYIRKYVNSEEFITDYENLKEDAMPLLNSNGRNISSLKKDKAVIELNIKNYKTDVKYVAEQQKILDETQKGIDALIAASKKSFPNKDAWEKLYPPKPEVFVKQRLQDYLALVATVDFNAALTDPDKYKKRKFVNPIFEKKNDKWKACFRAGKEVNETITAFAKEWLTGEIISKTKSKMTVVSNNEKISENENSKFKTDNTNNTTSEKNSNPNPTVASPTIEEPVKEKKGILNKVRKVIKQ